MQILRLRSLGGSGLCLSVLLMATGTLLLALGAVGGYWTYSAQDTAIRNRQAELDRLADTLAVACEPQLAADELTPVRRMVIDLAKTYNLSSATLELSDGRIVAAADPSQIAVQKLPARWSGPIDNATGHHGLGASKPIVIPGRGGMVLRLAAPPVATDELVKQIYTCLGAIGAVLLLVQGLIYRKLWRRMRSLSLIRTALRLFAGGETSRDVLQLAAEFGDEAAAWNRLLQQSTQAENAAVADRAKAALGDRRESKVDLVGAIDGLPVGVVILDAASKVQHVNGAAAALLRQKREDMAGIELSKFVDDQAMTDVLGRILGGAPIRRSVEIKLPGADGSVLRVHLRPLRKDDSGAAILTVEDITQQKIADSARNAFVAQATHELRTPLTNMRLCLEDALETEKLDPKQMAEHLNLLNQETRRLERMVGDMLSVAEIEAGSMKLRNEDVRLDKLVEDLRKDFEPQAAEKNITLKFELPPKLPVIYGDRDRLMVTLQNLVGNALKYTPRGGAVTVEMLCQPTQIQVRVRDTGIGISPENQAKLFGRFARADDPRVAKITGTGLGLAMARDVARLHGGDVTVESELDKGSTFTLTLPLQQAAAKAA